MCLAEEPLGALPSACEMHIQLDSGMMTDLAIADIPLLRLKCLELLLNYSLLYMGFCKLIALKLIIKSFSN